MLAEYFLGESCRRLAVPPLKLKQRHVETLQRYTWPGNVRELQNIVARAVIGAQAGPLEFDLPGDSRNNQPLSEVTVKPKSRAREILKYCPRWKQLIDGSPGRSAPRSCSDSNPLRWPPRSKRWACVRTKADSRVPTATTGLQAGDWDRKDLDHPPLLYAGSTIAEIGLRGAGATVKPLAYQRRWSCRWALVGRRARRRRRRSHRHPPS